MKRQICSFKYILTAFAIMFSLVIFLGINTYAKYDKSNDMSSFSNIEYNDSNSSSDDIGSIKMEDPIVENYTLTIVYLESNINDATDINIKKDDVSVQNISYGDSYQIIAASGETVRIYLSTVNTVNSFGEDCQYALSIDKAPRTYSKENFDSYDWVATSDVTINVYVAQSYILNFKLYKNDELVNNFDGIADINITINGAWFPAILGLTNVLKDSVYKITTTALDGYTIKTMIGYGDISTFEGSVTSETTTETKLYSKNTLTLNTGDGVVSVSGGGEYVFGESVEISATADTNYNNIQWTLISGEEPTSWDNLINQQTITIAGDCVLRADATLNAFTLSIDSNDGVTEVVNYENPSKTLLGISKPTRPGYFFDSWDFTGAGEYITPQYCTTEDDIHFDGTKAIAVDTKYKYTDKMTLSFNANADWNDFVNNNMSLLNSTHDDGGYRFGSSDGKITFICFDSGIGAYRTIDVGKTWESLDNVSTETDWHNFVVSFDGTYIRIFIDGELLKTSIEFDGEIGYHESNTIFIGGQAGDDAVSAVSNFFIGDISNVIFVNGGIEKSNQIDLNTDGIYVYGEDNAVLKANWIEDSREINFDGNGNTSGEMNDNQTIIRDFPLTLVDNAFNKSDYTFIGWSETNTGDVLYVDGQILSVEQVGIICDKTELNGTYTLYAIWKSDNVLFEDETLTALIIYGKEYTSDAFTGATNKFGTFTYQILDGAPSGITLSSETSRVFTGTTTDNIGIYNVTIQATQTESGKTANAIITLEITSNSDGIITVSTLENYIYNGLAQTLSIDTLEIKVNGVIIDKSECLISNIQQTNVGTYNDVNIEISAGNWKGSSTAGSWTIEKYTGELFITFDKSIYNYNNLSYSPTTVVKLENDVEVTSQVNIDGNISEKEVGNYRIFANGNNINIDNSSYGEAVWSITNSAITEIGFTGENEYSYNGAVQEVPELYVKSDSVTLIQDVDYILSGVITPQVNVGTYVITATGAGSYAGELNTTWSIIVYSGNITIELDNINYVYDGNIHTPLTVVKIGENIVTNITLSGDLSATNIGEYLITGTGDGVNISSLSTGTIGWKIVKKELSVINLNAIDRICDGTTKIEITGGDFLGLEAEDNVEFSVSDGVANNASAGENIPVSAIVIIAGEDAGNYMLLQPDYITVNLYRAKITFNNNGGELISGNEDLYVDYNSKVFYNQSIGGSEASIPTVYNNGYALTGWYDSLESTNQIISKDDIILNDFTNTNDIILYAIWDSTEVGYIKFQTLSDATCGVLYSDIFDPATSGSGNYIYSLDSGIIPKGLSIDYSSRTISGIPTVTGKFVIKICATDSVNGTEDFTDITINVYNKKITLEFSCSNAIILDDNARVNVVIYSNDAIYTTTVSRIKESIIEKLPNGEYFIEYSVTSNYTIVGMKSSFTINNDLTAKTILFNLFNASKDMSSYNLSCIIDTNNTINENFNITNNNSILLVKTNSISKNIFYIISIIIIYLTTMISKIIYKRKYENIN